MDDATVNHYVDLLAQEAIHKDAHKKANYKTYAYQNATKLVSFFDLCQRIDQLLDCAPIKQVNLEFVEISRSKRGIHVHAYHEDGHETFDDNPQFVYFLQTSDKEKIKIENYCDQLLKKLKSIQKDYDFFQHMLGIKVFNKTDTAVSFFAQVLPQAFAVIENDMITQSVSSTSSHSPKKKI